MYTMAGSRKPLVDLVRRVFLLIAIFLKGSNALTCYACDSFENIRACQTVRNCPSGQVCYIEEHLNTDFSLSYTMGCRAKNLCSVMKTPLVGRRVLTLCSECCESDLCQKNLCGQNGLAVSDHRGPICFECTVRGENGTCNSVKECGSNQACVQSIDLQLGGYVRSCQAAMICSLLTPSDDGCFKCCQNDLCNVGCH